MPKVKSSAAIIKFRKPLTISSRVSSITNSFVQAIIPNITPLQGEMEAALEILGMTYSHRTCVYCGVSATDWDHLRPLVKNKKPTGYVTEIRNLVPACGPCNQSKGSSEWEKWISGNAKGSPKAKGVADLSDRVTRLKAFVKWGNVEPLNLERLAGSELWNTHWQNLVAIERNMREAQTHAIQIGTAISKAFEGCRNLSEFEVET